MAAHRNYFFRLSFSIYLYTDADPFVAVPISDGTQSLGRLFLLLLDSTPPAPWQTPLFETIGRHLGAALANARRRHRPAAASPLSVSDIETAYAVQDGVALVMGWFAGRAVPQHWKSGGANRTAEMAHAPLPPQGVWPSPADARQWPFFHRGIEGEIALRLGQDVTPAQAATLDVEQARRLVDAMCVSIEVVDFRWAEAGAAPTWHKMADSLSHGALVLGEWVPFQPLDWSRQRCVATLGSQPTTEHVGTHPLGDPAFLLPAWLRHITRTGHTGHASQTPAGSSPGSSGSVTIA